MSTVFEISDRFTEAWADIEPMGATAYGIGGRDHLVPDLSPEGQASRYRLYQDFKAQLVPFLDSEVESDSLAAKVIVGWIDERLSEFDTQEWRRDLNHIFSPFQMIRDVFDVMSTDTDDAIANIATRLEAYPEMLAGYRSCLELGLAADDVVAVRQAESLHEQLLAAAEAESRFDAFRAASDDPRLASAIETAKAACGEMGDWLESAYLPAAAPNDAVGRERYIAGAEKFLGMTLDPEDTYEWGWGEVMRIREEMRGLAEEIQPGSSIGEVIEMLDTDPARAAQTRQEFVDFISEVQQDAIAKLAGTHFDVPPELESVTVNIAPPGGSLGAWYVGPSEDLTRPGSIWYAPGERKALPVWQEVSTAYHEGFPGHHLQVGIAVMNRESLSRFQRTVIWYPGSGEGWALYAERLMDELGFFDKPEYRLGLLSSQLFRSIRVVLDIGCQLELPLPDYAPMYAGETWNYDIGVDYMNKVGYQPRDVSESEVTRYLGWYGQAIAYKVGEREILAMRDRAREAGSFDQKGFHTRMLEAGAIRLDHLWEAMA